MPWLILLRLAALRESFKESDTSTETFLTKFIKAGFYEELKADRKLILKGSQEHELAKIRAGIKDIWRRECFGVMIKESGEIQSQRKRKFEEMPRSKKLLFCAGPKLLLNPKRGGSNLNSAE